MPAVAVSDALSLEPEEWSIRLAAWDLPRYRGQQVFRALHQELLEDWSGLRQLPQETRERLAEAFPLSLPRVSRRIVSADGTIRYLLSLADGEQIEAVYLPDEVFDAAGALGRQARNVLGAGAGPLPRGGARPQPDQREGVPSQGWPCHLRRRTTFCISSQAGCAVNCQFCMTATLGLRRSLTAGEIVGEVLRLLGEHDLRPGRGLDRVNVVFMGMGEPFLNYDNVVRAIRVLTRPEGAALAPRRITVSTAGIVDKIRLWGREAFPRGRPNLAISLNASSDEQRQRLMPLNRGQGGLEALLAAARDLPLGPREYVTFEYVLLAGVNDAPADADRVLALLHGMRAKVNLIAWNAGGTLPFAAPEREPVLAFQRRLIAGGVPTYIRRPRGRDIYAACGQLAKS